MTVDTFEHKPAITMEEANKIYNAMMEINAPSNFNLPEFSARKQFLETGEIINFNDDIAKKTIEMTFRMDFIQQKMISQAV